MKKVVFLYTGSSPQGGMATYLKMFFSYLSRQEVKPELWSVGQWEVAKNIESLGEVHYLTGLSELRKKLFEEKPSVLLTAGVKSNLYGRLASLGSAVHLVTTVHSDLVFDYTGWRKILFFVLDRLFRFRTDFYITVSEYLKERLLKNGVSANKVTVLYNGMEFPEIKEKQRGGERIVSLGRLHQTKGFDALIEAFKLLPQDFTLTIYGEGAERKRLEKQIQTHNLRSRVNLAGKTSNLKSVFEAADIYIQPSRMEGFGLALAEAMGAGLPVIASSCGSLPELVEDKKTGLLLRELTPAEVAKKIQELANDSDLAEKLGREAAASVRKRFDVQSWAQKYEQIILELK